MERSLRGDLVNFRPAARGSRTWRLFAVALIAATLAAAADSPIADAAQRGDRSAVEAMIAGRVNVNQAQPNGTTALHWAAQQDDLRLARILIEAGAEVKAANRYGVTALSLACTNGSAPMVELLLNEGADREARLPGGETPLMIAARTGRVEAVQALLKRGAAVNATEGRGQTALMWAAAEGHAETIEALLKAGADLKVRLDSGYNALLFAVREGRMEAVKALLKAGADVNDTIVLAPGKKPPSRGARAGSSALILAVLNAHFELAAALLDAGADPNANGPGYTALHVLTIVRKPGLGDNDPAPDGSGNLTSIELVKKFAAQGADLNSRMTKRVGLGLTSLNTLGATPFVMAARAGDAELMRTLAALGADPKIPTTDGANAIIVAAGLGTRSPGEDAGTEGEIVEALQVAIELGVDINAVDKNGETAMHGAAYRNHPLAVKLLAQKGADIKIWNRPNKSGWTPLRIAEGYRFGNYKPSPPTVAALQEVMLAAGVEPVSQPKAASAQ